MENRECGSSTGNGKMKIEKQKGNELGITVPFLVLVPRPPIPDLHFQVPVPQFVI